MAYDGSFAKISTRDWVLGLVLVAAVLLVYSPVGWAGYVWDDDVLLTANATIVGAHGLREVWTSTAADICPLTITTFWLLHKVCGLAPLPYHLVNVLLHGADALLLWVVLRRLLVPGAWLGAALWALHPIQVESVAWIAEMKNTESTLFYLLSVLFFLKWLEPGEPSAVVWRRYAVTLVFAAMAMACKTSTAVLPLVLGLCAWWMQREPIWRAAKVILPTLAFSFVAGLVTLASANSSDPHPDPQWILSWPERLIVAGKVTWFYLGKLVWPYPLMANHPRWPIDAGDWTAYIPLVLALAVGVALWSKRGSWGRGLCFALGYYLIAILPVLGLVGYYFSRFSFVSYHLQYLAAMGPLALIGAALANGVTRFYSARIYVAASACVLLILGVVSWQRCWVYQSDEALSADTLSKNPGSWVAHNNLGKALFYRGDMANAAEQFRQSIRINPNFDRSHDNLGSTLFHMDKVDDAMVEYREALRINPDLVQAISNLGDAYVQKGQYDEGIKLYRKAVEVDPNFEDVEFNWGYALLLKGEPWEAVGHYQKILATNPQYTGAYSNLAAAYLKMGDVIRAERTFRAGLKINPDYDVLHYNLAELLIRENRLDEAIAEFQKAVQLNPNYADACKGLGLAYFKKGMKAAAIEQFQNAIRINPDDQEARSNLAKVEQMP